VFGALVLCRPTFWPMAILAFMAWLAAGISAYRTKSIEFLSAGRSAGQLPWRIIAGTLLVVGPWIARNQMVMRSPIVMTTHGGYTLLLANNPVFYSDVVDQGWGTVWEKESFEFWRDELQSSMTQELGPTASELDRDRWQSERARRIIRAEPWRFAKATWFRIRSLWSTVPLGEAAANQSSRLIQLVGWYYTFILISFGMGLLRVLGRRGMFRRAAIPAPTAGIAMQRTSEEVGARWWSLMAIVVTVQLVHLVYWTNARMRAPIVPVVSLFAAAAFEALSKKSARSS
jgi:hypothetical protein